MNDIERSFHAGATVNGLYGLYVRMMRWLGHYRWFSLYVKHIGSKFDRALLRVTRGRLSALGRAMPTMLLTTTGNKTGKKRTVPVFYVLDGKNVVAVCENFGLEAASSWPKNLRSDPRARIEIEGTAASYIARSATQEEIDRNMPSLIAMWPAHDTYLKRGGARYVFVFEPVDVTTPMEATVATA
ncbi:Deazaflavin-dependent nitroreductase [Mycobacterium simulans]|uniref:nitroreductase/quinone reductase family protein n=1 Tax=Mycobacterium simulans TaxID=627089 RepID=UPI0019C9682E|nr:nitroreductase/quinone reductase family protein [Mycobacterium simulans]SON62775.1 Deazaflavin-dependent nitroreductase [Mycobacterium simulans]